MSYKVKDVYFVVQLLTKKFTELGEKCKKEDISPEEIQPLTKICQDELGI